MEAWKGGRFTFATSLMGPFSEGGNVRQIVGFREVLYRTGIFIAHCSLAWSYTIV